MRWPILDAGAKKRSPHVVGYQRVKILITTYSSESSLVVWCQVNYHLRHPTLSGQDLDWDSGSQGHQVEGNLNLEF